MSTAVHNEIEKLAAAMRTANDEAVSLAIGTLDVVDAYDDKGRTALIHAAELEHAGAVEQLLARGADPTLPTQSPHSFTTPL
jgi:ankyrin repeat protein